MSKVSNPIHAVFNTYCRRMTIGADNADALYRYIWTMLKTRGCHLYRIGGIENHVHLLFDLNPNHALKDVIRDIKRETSKWMKSSGLFPAFEGWGKEYFANSYSQDHIGAVIDYIRNQREHHRVKSFEEEMQQLFERLGLEWSENLLT